MSSFEKLISVTHEKNIPLTVIIELTGRCNLFCGHCYLLKENKRPDPLTTIRIKELLSELASAGTLNLVFTGGEAFLRADFMELCAYARRLGFDLRIFTNGTLIDKKLPDS